MTSWAAPDSGLRPRTCSSASVLLRPGTDTASAMLPPRTALLWTLVLAAGFLGLGARRPPQRPSPISAIQPKAGFDAQQVEPGAVGRRQLAPLRREGQAGSPIPSGLTPLPPVCRDLVPRGRGLLLSLPAGAGPPCGGHRSEGGAPGCSHGCQHLPEAVSSARPHGHPSPDHPPVACPAAQGGCPSCCASPLPGMASAGRFGSSTETRRSRAASCSEVRQGSRRGCRARGGADLTGPALPSSRREGRCARGRRGDGLPELRHPVPGAGAAAVGEAVRCVLAGALAPCTLGSTGELDQPRWTHSPPPPSLPPGVLTFCQSIGGSGTHPCR